MGEDGKKLQEFLEKSPKIKVKELIDKLEKSNDDQLNELADLLKSLL